MSITSRIRRTVYSHDVDDLASIWSRQPGLFRFLDEQAQVDTKGVVLYAHILDSEDHGLDYGRLRVRTALVPPATLSAIAASAKHKWQDPHDFGMWSVTGDSNNPARIERDHFELDDHVLHDAQPLVFGRCFLGRDEDKNYYDIDQTLLHSLDLHWTPEQRAWCRFDEAKDVEKVITWCGDDETDGSECIAMDRETLERYLTASDTVLVQMFESALLLPSTTGSSKGTMDRGEGVTEDGQRHYAYCMTDESSRYYGIQVIASRYSKLDLGRMMEEARTRRGPYEKFIIGTRDGRELGMSSCDPACLRNLYEDTPDKPSEMSAVYFKPQVLDRYSGNPGKYKMTSRQIFRRSAPLLQTYSVNSANQVVTYIYYLGLLPHDEQVYWKAFNESPKDGISEEAICTDIEGKLFEGPDAIRDLKYMVAVRLSRVDWFRAVMPNRVDALGLPLTDNKKQWSDMFGVMEQVTVQPLNKRFFCRVAGLTRADGVSEWGSILCMEKALAASGDGGDVVRSIAGPFREVRKLRSMLFGHDAGPHRARCFARLRREHGSPRRHVETLCAQLANSFEHLLERWPGERGNKS